MAHHPAPVSSCVCSPQGVPPLQQCCPSLGSEHWVKNGPSPPEPEPGLEGALGGNQGGPKGPEAVGGLQQGRRGLLRPPGHHQGRLPVTLGHPVAAMPGPGLDSSTCSHSFWLSPGRGALPTGTSSFLPASSSGPHLAPPTLSSTSDPFASSSSALSLFPAVTLRKISSVALTPTLCFQDFRKYEEGFDPYSMVRQNAPPPGESSQECG